MKVKIYLEVIKKLRENGIELNPEMIDDIFDIDEDYVSLLSNIHNKDNYFSISNMLKNISMMVPKNKIVEVIKIMDSCDDTEKVELLANLCRYDWFNILPNSNEVISTLLQCKDAEILNEAIKSIYKIQIYFAKKNDIQLGSVKTTMMNAAAETFSKCKNSDRASDIASLIEHFDSPQNRKLYKLIKASEYIAEVKSDSMANIIYEALYQGDILNREDSLNICKTIVNAKSYNRADAALSMLFNSQFLIANRLHNFVKMAAYAKSDSHALALRNIALQNILYLTGYNEDKMLTIFKIINKVEDEELLYSLATAKKIGKDISDWLPLVSEEQLEKDENYPNNYVSFLISQADEAYFDDLIGTDIDAAIEGLEELTTINPDLDYTEPADIIVKVKKPNNNNNLGE